MDVLLINPPIRELEPPCYFPDGLGHVARAIKNDGHNIKLLEINAYKYSQDEIIKIIKQTKFDTVGISGLVTVYRYIKWLTPKIKEINPSAKIIVGGTVTSVPELLLNKTCADVLVHDEGEVTIKYILKAIEEDKNLRNIKGISFKENREIIRTERRPSIKNIDDIPFPAYEIFPVRIYLRNALKTGLFKSRYGLPRKSLTMISSRGCPYRCTFCNRDVNIVPRLRSADNVIEEMKLLKKNYNIKGILFNDELMITNKQRIYEFCDKLHEQKLNIKWACNGRVNLADEKLLRKMKEGGCTSVSYGIESGSQKMLDEMNKAVTVEQNARAIKLARKVGIRHTSTYFIGMPEETEETIQETVDFIKKMDEKQYFLGFATPYPGTALYKDAIEKGLIKDTEKFVEELEDTRKFILNLTKLPDKELFELKNKAELEIRKHYFRKHKIEYLKMLNKSAKASYKFYKRYGLKELVNKAIEKLRII